MPRRLPSVVLGLLVMFFVAAFFFDKWYGRSANGSASTSHDAIAGVQQIETTKSADPNINASQFHAVATASNRWMGKEIATQHSENLKKLYAATTERDVQAAADVLGRYDLDGVAQAIASSQFCNAAQNASKGQIGGSSQGREYLISHFQSYCDPAKTYDLSGVANRMMQLQNLQKTGSADFVKLAEISSSEGNDIGVHIGELRDIVIDTDSPMVFEEAAQKFLLQTETDTLNATCSGAPDLSCIGTVSETAAELAACEMSNSCYDPNSLRIMLQCQSRPICYNGITFFDFLQQTIPPAQFQARQDLAQRLLALRYRTAG